MAITSATVSPQYLYYQAPIEFIIGDFSGKKRANEKWVSPLIYTHNRGYKFHLNVHPNGYDTGKGSHLSVSAQLMRGEYDNDLEWPFESDIRLQLLNWNEDNNHHSNTIHFNRSVSRRHSDHLNDQKTATSFGDPLYMSHAELEPNSNTRYLMSNHFKLRLSVAVYSTPPLLLVPSWQGSSENTVTISEYSKRKHFGNIYYSPPFTTSPRGYKFCFKMYANGYDSGKGSHIAIRVVIMKGDHDEHLKWPFTGNFFVEVLNWKEDKEHHKETFTIDTNNGFDKVTRGEYGNEYGFKDFIPQSSLSPSNNIQYLYQDCICVRVRNS